ncbi:MAG: M36 family metallopeptidase, partial [Candidatus Eisenbacteria bacterium]
DWFYDAGFNETSGNAQASNFGRGGVEGDNLRAEAQDYGGVNNANMSTPADGARPRMQMYVWNTAGSRLTVNSPDAIAGDKTFGTATFGPQGYSVTADVVLVNDGTGTTTDACETIVNSVAGNIALIDVGTCTSSSKVLKAQNAGAVGAIIVNSTTSVSTMTGTAAITIPSMMVTSTDGAAIKTALGSGTVNVTMSRPGRDGTIDNQIVAHEWGHYISNRLIGDASGLSNNQGGGMGEGWSDFHAMLLTVRPEDALVASNPNFSGVYAMAGYALQYALAPANEYYFGIRRYPYSTDFGKNPLTFRHIQNGVPLPVGPPVRFGADGANNAQVHRTGEVWCAMLWECYAGLLLDTGRLTFDQARDRMRQYLVAGYKMTPNAPTFVEARDALLAAVYASDPTDFGAFCAAFARRGAGVGAVAPDRNSTDHIGVVESYVCGGDLQLVSATLDDAVHTCDADAYLDEGEIGYFTVTLKNAGSTNLGATTATLSSTNPSIVFQSGTTLPFPPSQPFGTTTASAVVRSSGAAGIQVQDIQVQYDDPGLAIAGPRTSNFGARGNVDEVPSANE